VIRVFVSSTFRDMQGEREELIKRTFPQLRKLCEQRGVSWGEVDLRWGVSDEQKAEGKVLPVCLAEIRNCRPYFIGLLGERYGWVPEEFPAAILEQYPWLENCRGRSVTELEILYGALNDPAMAGHAFFYFRDPGYIQSLPPAQQPVFRESATNEESDRYGTLEAVRRAEERIQKLIQLKQRIRASRLRVRENYPNPRALGEFVIADLKSIIDRLYPQGSQIDPLDREATEHEAFAQSRARIYIGRQAYYDRLDEHAHGEGLPLAIVGESGLGKSALLANWGLAYRASHSRDLVLTHFIGSSPASADWTALVRRIAGELKRRLGINIEIPDKAEALRATFANALYMAATKIRIVLILDSLNQLEDRDGAQDLVWLPAELPANVRLLVSTLPGRALDEIKQRGWSALEVNPLEAEERRRLITEYLKQYTKELSPVFEKQIADAAPAGNPLYLRALLEELRLWGDHEFLREQISYYLSAATTEELYQKILERYEKDYEGDRPGLVREAMSLLWAARRGLSESELLDLLGVNGQPLAHAIWSPLYLAAEAALVNHSGLLGFFHGYLRQAVYSRYLSASLASTDIRRRLADYFDAAALCARKIEELPWLRAQSWEFTRLYDLLRNLEFLKAAFTADPTGVKEYWSLLEYGGPVHGPGPIPGTYQISKAYREVIDNPAAHPDVIGVVGPLLNEMGLWKEYEPLCRRLIEQYRREGSRDRLAREIGNLANLLIRKGAFDEASRLLAETRELLGRNWNPGAAEEWLGTVAMLAYERGDLSAAWTALEGQEEILRNLGDKDRLAGCLSQKSFILHSSGQHAEALVLLQEAMSLAQQTGNLVSRQAIVGEMALNYLDMGEASIALKLLDEQVDLCRRLGDLESLAGAFGNQANIYLRRGDRQTSHSLYSGMEQIGKRIGHGRLEHVGRSGRAAVWLLAGDLRHAERLLQGTPEFFRSAGMKEQLLRALKLEGDIRLAGGNLDPAMKSYREAVQVSAEVSPREQAVLCRSIAEGLLAEPQRTGGFTMEDFERSVRRLDQGRDRAQHATEFLGQAVLADPRSAETQYLLGIALDALGRNEEALAAFRHALTLKPDWTDAEVRIAELLLKQESGI
jgi:tetratricopeptide (TPR) repeat protein